MENKILIVVDMQNDFITGSLANPAAQAIVQPMADYIKNFDGEVVFTYDDHTDNYLETLEGKNLPIEHCISLSEGWQVESSLWVAAKNKPIGTIYKPSFGYKDWDKVKKFKNCDEIILVGTCTDICVISNALILKAQFPETKIKVISDLCAGLTPEKHQAALEVMKSCQIEVITLQEEENND